MHILYSVQARTHQGKVRKNNQDAYGTVLDWRDKLNLTDEVLQQRWHLFAIADGMGGHAAGEVASQLALDTLFIEYYTGEWIDPKTTLAAAIAAANQAIFEMAQANIEMEGMGTTLTAVALDLATREYVLGHVGDSRAYRLRAGELVQLTRDDTWVQERVDTNELTLEQARDHPYGHILTQCVGLEEPPVPHLHDGTALAGDVFLLCSDGLVGMLEDEDIALILREQLGDAGDPEVLEPAAHALVAAANEAGGYDNITLIILLIA